jgi:hypothetical protein
MTKMMDTYIGHHYVHEEIVNSIVTVMHDIFVHGNHNRITRITSDELNKNKKFILLALKELDNDIFKLLMKNIQYIQNEENGLRALSAASRAKEYNKPIKETKVILDGDNGKKFLLENLKFSSFNRNLISKPEITNYETLIKWLGGEGIIKKQTWDEYYTIIK